jgi:poly-beta-1,6-N-acetyl-D-glucosamine biosynthesis protein PgaD
LFLLVSWALYNKSRYSPRQTASGTPPDTEALSSSFHLPTQDVRYLQGSQVCIIHHEPDGAISQIEPQTEVKERLRLIA